RAAGPARHAPIAADHRPTSKRRCLSGRAKCHGSATGGETNPQSLAVSSSEGGGHPSLIGVLRHRIAALRRRLTLVAVTEVTMAGAAHDRLRAFQPDVRIIALTECPVPIAGEQVPDVPQPH